MPFKKYVRSQDPHGDTYGKVIDITATSHYNSPMFKHADELPIFLFPGILGNGDEQLRLAEHLCRNSESDRTILIYSHPLIKPKNGSTVTTFTSLQHQAEVIADELIGYFNHRSLPFIFAGYSFGCALASAVTECIERKYPSDRRNPSQLYLIDGASPDCSQTYFMGDSETVDKDLVSIFNAIANLCRFSPMKYSASIKTELQGLTLGEKIDRLESLLLYPQGQVANETKRSYSNYVAVVKQNLLALKDYKKPEGMTGKQPTIDAFITVPTAAKYGMKDCGWSKHTAPDSFNLISHKEIDNKPHLQLLVPKAVEVLATLISDLIRKSISELIPQVAAEMTLESVQQFCGTSHGSESLKKIHSYLSQTLQIIQQNQARANQHSIDDSPTTSDKSSDIDSESEMPGSALSEDGRDSGYVTPPTLSPKEGLSPKHVFSLPSTRRQSPTQERNAGHTNVNGLPSENGMFFDKNNPKRARPSSMSAVDARAAGITTNVVRRPPHTF